MTRHAVRLAALLALALALVPSAGARGLGGPIPYQTQNGAPTNLHAFLLRPDEAAQSYYPRTPSFTWNPVAARGGSYEFELATSRTFDDAVILFRYTKLKIPALSVDHQLPWMTGSPYALWAHVRWVSADGKKVSRWSDPLGFNMRWRDTEYPTQEDAPPGMVRWSPIEGATGYEVLYTDIHPAASFTTTTNVADEREYFTLHDTLGWSSSVHWRVRAIRFINDKDVLVNGLPRVTYGPWSKPFTSVNPPKSLGTLTPAATVSDTWDKPGQPVRAHDLTPGFAWSASAPAVTDIASFGSSLYRVYISTDDQCVNRVFTGSVVGSPAFAPRTTGGPSALPQTAKTLAKWMAGETGTGTEGRSYDATGKDVVPNETPGATVSGGSGGSGSSGAAPASTGPVAAAGVDLWDSGWPTGRYYWTVVPVTVEFKIPTDPTSTDPAIEYHDMAVPQDSCQAGFGMSFGKVSEPVVTRDGAPFVSGLTPSGRVVASAGRNPKVHDSPLVAWLPAVGATSYELELSRKLYPWTAAKSLATYATSAVLPLAKADNGVWYYRVRGVNPALPAGAQKMSWSHPVKIRVTGDQFVVVSR